MEDIDRIEVIRGPGGTIWGPNAVNGVINIITKSTSETDGTLVKVRGGSVEQGTLAVRQGGKRGKLSYRGYAKAFNRGAQYHPDGRNFDDWHGLQGGFRMDWAESARDGFTFQGDIYDQRLGESVVATSYTPPYQQTIDRDAVLSGGNILGRWKRDLGEGQGLQLQVYYDRANRYEPNFTDLRDTFDVDFMHRVRPFARNQFSWGLGARFSRGHNLEVVSGLTFEPARRTDRLLSAFLQDDISLVEDKLSLSVGDEVPGDELQSAAAPAQRAADIYADGEADLVGSLYARRANAIGCRAGFLPVRIYRDRARRITVFRPLQCEPELPLRADERLRIRLSSTTRFEALH